MKLPTRGRELHRFAFLDGLPWLQGREQMEHGTGEASALMLGHGSTNTSFLERMN